jgi:hypothetical protein
MIASNTQNGLYYHALLSIANHMAFTIIATTTAVVVITIRCHYHGRYHHL